MTKSTIHPETRFVAVLLELREATALTTRILWESKGPKDTGIAHHGSAAVFIDGQPCGIVYVQVFKSGNGFEIFLGAPGGRKDEGFAWIKQCVEAIKVGG